MENSLPQSLSDLLSMMGNTDPRLQMLAEFIKRQQLGGVETQNVLDKTNNESKVLLRLENENKLLQERIDVLGAALGACSCCFGTVPTCQYCQGQGSVGSRYPNKEAYMRYILPVVQRFGSLLLAENEHEVHTEKTT